MEDRIQCRLCRKFFSSNEMSEEHVPAHSVGNDDLVVIDPVDLMELKMGKSRKYIDYTQFAKKSGKDEEKINDDFFDEVLVEKSYKRGRTERTLCRKCNTFLGKYDEAYKKFYDVDGNPKVLKGYKQSTKVDIIKAIYAKFISIPETRDEEFDFLDFINDRNSNEYNGKWNLYFVKRNNSTSFMGFQDIPTGKVCFPELGVVYEFSDDKFIFNLMNFERHEDFIMNSIFDILEKNYTLVEGFNDPYKNYHIQMNHHLFG